MTYKTYLEDQFMFHDLDKGGYLQYSRIENKFFYSPELSAMCATVATCVDNVIQIDNIPLLARYMPGVLDEMISELVKEFTAEQDITTQEFISQTEARINKLHTIAYAKMLIKKN